MARPHPDDGPPSVRHPDDVRTTPRSHPDDGPRSIRHPDDPPNSGGDLPQEPLQITLKEPQPFRADRPSRPRGLPDDVIEEIEAEENDD